MSNCNPLVNTAIEAQKAVCNATIELLTHGFNGTISELQNLLNSYQLQVSSLEAE